MLLPVPSLQSQCFSFHPIHKVPRATLVLLLNGNWDCILLSIALANLQAHNSNAGPHARGSRGRVLFSSACILDMAAFCRLTRAEGRNRDPGSSMVRWLLQRTYLVQRAEQVAQTFSSLAALLGFPSTDARGAIFF